jgi:hypothetical protein
MACLLFLRHWESFISRAGFQQDSSMDLSGLNLLTVSVMRHVEDGLVLDCGTLHYLPYLYWSRFDPE